MDKENGIVIWLTGLSGSGKSTISEATEKILKARGYLPARLDGDDLRTGLNADLGFSPQHRSENLRRAAHVALLFSKMSHVTICSFITPLESDRAMVRELVGDAYKEVYVRASLAECERRDPKGLYKRARSGELTDFTGVSATFEVPRYPDIVLDTERMTVEEAVEELISRIGFNANKGEPN